MEIKLDEQQEAEIRTLIFKIVNDALLQLSNNERPYLNRKDIAKYFGVAPSTIDVWLKQGMPVAVIDGRKLYGKKSITNWLESKEKSASPEQ